MESGNDDTAVLLTSGASGRINALISLRAWRSFLTLINAFLLILLFPFRGRRKSPVPPPISREKIGSNKGLPAVRVPTNIVLWKSCSTARRALAIRRVLQESAAEGELAREFYLFVTARGDALFTQTWTPVLTKTRGLFVLLHGLNEHSGRYSDFAKQLNASGYKVYGMDWIGTENVLTGAHWQVTV